MLQLSEDAYQGDAQFTVSVDGKQLGGAQTVSASHAAGQTQAVSVGVSLTPGSHTVGVSFINDAYGGSPSSDRNLYVNSVTYDGAAAPMAGTVEQAANGVATIQVPAATGNSLTLALSEDAYNGDAQFSLAIDGKAVGANTAVTASHAAGATQLFNFAGLGAGTHDVALSFVNDAYGGSPSADRNLYLSGATLNGTALDASTWQQAFYNNGATHFSLVVPAS